MIDVSYSKRKCCFFSIATLLLLATFESVAGKELEQTSDASPRSSTGLAWEYRKDGNASYLLGSVHFADSSFYPLPGAIMAAYDRSETLVVEVDDSLVPVEQQQALIAKYGQYPPGKSLSSELSPATLTVLRALLKEFELPLVAVNTYRPGLLAVSLTALQAAKLGYSAEQGLDRYFMQKARFKKTIRQIETFEAQMALLAALPEDDLLLRDSFENMQDYASQWQETMAAWKAGDGEALYDATIGAALTEHPALQPYFDVLFFDRHAKMTAEAERCISRNETCFIVVGAGHLVGEQGLLKALERKGYQIAQLK